MLRDLRFLTIILLGTLSIILTLRPFKPYPLQSPLIPSSFSLFPSCHLSLCPSFVYPVPFLRLKSTSVILLYFVLLSKCFFSRLTCYYSEKVDSTEPKRCLKVCLAERPKDLKGRGESKPTQGRETELNPPKCNRTQSKVYLPRYQKEGPPIPIAVEAIQHHMTALDRTIAGRNRES